MVRAKFTPQRTSLMDNRSSWFNYRYWIFSTVALTRRQDEICRYKPAKKKKRRLIASRVRDRQADRAERGKRFWDHNKQTTKTASIIFRFCSRPERWTKRWPCFDSLSSAVTLFISILSRRLTKACQTNRNIKERSKRNIPINRVVKLVGSGRSVRSLVRSAPRKLTR